MQSVKIESLKALEKWQAGPKIVFVWESFYQKVVIVGLRCVYC